MCTGGTKPHFPCQNICVNGWDKSTLSLINNVCERMGQIHPFHNKEFVWTGGTNPLFPWQRICANGWDKFTLSLINNPAFSGQRIRVNGWDKIIHPFPGKQFVWTGGINPPFPWERICMNWWDKSAFQWQGNCVNGWDKSTLFLWKNLCCRPKLSRADS